MNRRTFVKRSAFGALSIPLISTNPLLSFPPKSIKLTILHTNDMHSHIDPFSANDSKYPGMGGMRKMASIVEKIRKEEDHVLLLDAGDIFQGTPYFNKYKGEVELKIMSEMGYAASTMGNHDFDNGINGFNDVLSYANFPFLCSNYDFSNTVLNGKTKKFITKTIGELKVGLFGIGIKLNGLVEKRLYKETQYYEPIEIANHYAEILKDEHNCDIVICLSHLGYDYDSNKISDVKLAKATKGIDIIIGGHTHTFLDKATELENSSGDMVLVNQAGWGALCLGRIDVNFSNQSNSKKELSLQSVSKKNYAKI
ncbi:MAG: metallophosphatase [Crocinitomicaceae bacterium]|nr:metallophosphatase [Crocinitomicaceae bacterium]